MTDFRDMATEGPASGPERERREYLRARHAEGEARGEFPGWALERFAVRFPGVSVPQGEPLEAAEGAPFAGCVRDAYGWWVRT